MSEARQLQPAQQATPQHDVLEVKAQTVAIHNLMEEVMVKDTHYGVIPGTGNKPSLLKPGAEKIAVLLHLAPAFKRETQWDGEHMTVFSECTLTHQGTGVVIASAGGLCTTKETKYAYRQATRKCPACGATNTIIKGKKEYGGGWLCYRNKGGCGAKYDENDPQITTQSGDREANLNLPDAYNTVVKMADKRAFVAATLFGTAASDIFTQDVEDFRDEVNAAHAPRPAREETDIPDPPSRGGYREEANTTPADGDQPFASGQQIGAWRKRLNGCKSEEEIKKVFKDISDAGVQITRDQEEALTQTADQVRANIDHVAQEQQAGMPGVE